jgi:hypothetical protein
MTAVLMLSVAMPVMAQDTLTGKFADPSPGQGGSGTGSGGSLDSCSRVTDKGASGLVGCIVGIFNTAIGLIISAAVVYIVWGAFTMIRSEEKREEGKKVILYGVIGLFAMVSIWGFVNILTKTFGTNDTQDNIIPVLIK